MSHWRLHRLLHIKAPRIQLWQHVQGPCCSTGAKLVSRESERGVDYSVAKQTAQLHNEGDPELGGKNIVRAYGMRDQHIIKLRAFNIFAQLAMMIVRNDCAAYVHVFCLFLSRVHLPVGYHGRASSIVPSGRGVRRPW